MIRCYSQSKCTVANGKVVTKDIAWYVEKFTTKFRQSTINCRSIVI